MVTELQGSGEYTMAVVLAEKAVDQAKSEFGIESQHYRVSLVKLAIIYQKLDKREEALSLYLEALENTKKNLGKEHSDYGIMLGHLSGFYIENNEYDKTIPLYLDALENTKKNFGKDHPNYGLFSTRLAFSYSWTNQFDKSIPVYLDALENTERNVGKDHPNYGQILFFLAISYVETNQYDEAQSLFLEALENTEKNYGRGHSEYGICLSYLANLYFRSGQYDKALPLYLEALENTGKNLGTDHSEYGDFLSKIAGVYHSLGQYEKGLPFAEQALQNTEKNLGKNHSQYGLRLNNLASLYEKLGQYDKALPLYLQSIENIEGGSGKESSEYGVRLSNLAGLYYAMGLYEKSLMLYLEALENIEKTDGKNHSNYGLVQNNLAALYFELGQYDKALPLYLEALETTGETLGKEHSEYGVRLSNLAALYQRIGQYNNAILLNRQALENTERTLGKNHFEYGARLNNLAALYYELGQYDKALPLYLEFLDNTEKNMGKDHPNYGTGLSNLAALYEEVGQYKDALNLSVQALENTEKSLGTNHSSYAIILNNLAILYERIGEYDNAVQMLLKALDITEKSLGKDHSSYSMGLNNLAALYKTMGKYDKALPLYLEALEAIAKNYGKHHLNYVIILNNLAELHRSMSQYEKAQLLYLEALRNVYDRLRQAFSFMSETEKEQYTKTLAYDLEVYISFFTDYTAKKPEVAGNAFDIALATKGMILQSGIQMRQIILNSSNANALTKHDDWVACRNLIAKQYALPKADRRSDLKNLEVKAENLESELTRLSNAFQKTTALNKVNWRDVHKSLKRGEAAIEFSSFRYNSGKGWTDSTLYIALVLKKDEVQPKLVYLCEQRQLDSLLNHKPDNVVGFVASLYRGGEAEIQSNPKLGKRLYDLIWRPIDSLLSDVSTIYFAPSGTLHQVAFSAMPDSETKLLSDRYQLRQLSTTANLVQSSTIRSNSNISIALFGGIQYDVTPEEKAAHIGSIPDEAHFVSRALPDDLDRGNENWTYLPGTLREVNSIVALAEEKKISTQLNTSSKATEEAFKQLTGKKSPQVLHISTHGFFFPDPKKEKLNDIISIPAEKHVYRSSDNPLQRAGLLFAGSNNAWRGEQLPQGIDDGILTAYEVTNVTLSNTQLVVLSACETALGDIKGSEGVFGLQRAFKAAGAEYLMMSLWKVPDHETAEFMEFFYKQYFAGKNIPDAFHETQTHMKKRYPNDPYKWAAFVLVR